VAAQSSSASCEADEVMISAYCSGTFQRVSAGSRGEWRALRQQPPFDHPARHDRVRKTIERLAWLEMWDGTGEYITEHLAGVEDSPLT
jgi:hypothetical protein